MLGVVSLLDSHHDRQVKIIWDDLKRMFGVHPLHGKPFPHFSYHVASSYRLDALGAVLRDFAQRSGKFSVKTTGLGVFTGARPVVYVPVIRSPQLTELHRELWPEISKTAGGIMDYYYPNSWVPHITLAQGGLEAERLGEIIAFLNTHEYTWDVMVDNFAVLYDSGIEQSVKFRFDFR